MRLIFSKLKLSELSSKSRSTFCSSLPKKNNITKNTRNKINESIASNK